MYDAVTGGMVTQAPPRGASAGDASVGDAGGAATAMAVLVSAVAEAAERRGLTGDPRWTAAFDVLQDWAGEPSVADAIDTAVDAISAVFALDAASANLLLVAAAADLDPNIALAYGLLVGAEGPRPATVALALELAGASVADPAGRLALGEAAPLRAWGLVRVGAGEWALGRTVTVDESVIVALLGGVDGAVGGWGASPRAGSTDAAVAAMMLPDREPGLDAPDDGLDGDLDGGFDDFDGGPDSVDAGADAGPDARPGVAPVGSAEIAAALAADRPVCWVENPAGGAGLAAARAAFRDADIRSVTVDVGRRPATLSAQEAARRAVRYAGLSRSGLIIASAETLAEGGDGAAIGILADAPIPVVMVGSCRWNAAWHRDLPVVVRAAPLPLAGRIAAWRRFVTADDVSDAALAPYRLTPRQIGIVGRSLAGRAAAATPVVVAETVRMLGGAAGVRSGAGWTPTTFADLQLPVGTRAELDRFASWVRLRDEVTARGAVQGLGGKGTGIAALFTGSPGTGKTLAAHVIADTAGLDLMQVDLSGVVDKYIGETEKNLERIFAEAESLNVVLFFDEADSLFGKRSDVRDAHDRFANQEVSYLLQRMEQFDGITVLATNLKGNLDVAFSRRLHFIVHFPDPDEATRVALWEQLLRAARPVDAGDPVDVPKLAAALEVSGGDIRNIVLGAVYDAAAEGDALGMRHVLRAARREYAKLGRRVPAELS